LMSFSSEMILLTTLWSPDAPAMVNGGVWGEEMESGDWIEPKCGERLFDSATKEGAESGLLPRVGRKEYDVRVNNKGLCVEAPGLRCGSARMNVGCACRPGARQIPFLAHNAAAITNGAPLHRAHKIRI
jgi:hypothetical protein